MQTRGVATTVPGLFFIGLPFMYAGASALLGGVGRDAAYLVDRMASGAAWPVWAIAESQPQCPDRETAAHRHRIIDEKAHDTDLSRSAAAA